MPVFPPRDLPLGVPSDCQFAVEFAPFSYLEMRPIQG